MELYYVTLAVIAATASASLALGVLAWRQRPEPGSTWLAISMFASTWWKTTIGVRLGAETQLEHASGLRLWLVVWGTRQIGGSVAFDGDDDSIVTLRVNRCEPPTGTTGSSDRSPVADSTIQE